LPGSYKKFNTIRECIRCGAKISRKEKCVECPFCLYDKKCKY
jgi:endogenous inhibitor of DNA gyrase (YacG/DUF329 family)